MEHIKLPLHTGFHRTGDGAIIYDAKNLRVCHCNNGSLQTRELQATELVKACNAYPDLLEACKACIAIIGIKDIGPAKDKATAAIAKAEGE